MLKNVFNNVRINNETAIITPEKLKQEFNLSNNEQCTIINFRHTIADIIHKKDHRLLVVCGPCSIHDPDAAIDYAHRLHSIATQLHEYLFIVMRVYFEKPRTAIGWKGLINDPYMDNSFCIEEGLKIARNLLIKLTKIGLPLATEVLDPNISQYIGDLFSWSAIGARTTESQIHRELASGLSSPVGFKNSTDGSLLPAINAIKAAAASHCFMSINQSGQICILKTKGNLDTHIILRGGKQPNYYPKDIINFEQQLSLADLPVTLMIDCSHSNSNKDYTRQIKVAQSVITQIKSGNNSIIGIMLESNIYAGNQSIESQHKNIQYGISVTDSCIDWKSTECLLHQFYRDLKVVLLQRLKK